MEDKKNQRGAWSLVYASVSIIILCYAFVYLISYLLLTGECNCPCDDLIRARCLELESLFSRQRLVMIPAGIFAVIFSALGKFLMAIALISLAFVMFFTRAVDDSQCFISCEAKKVENIAAGRVK